MGYKKILTFSFDDGITQDERFINILNKYGLKCTFNLNSELLGKEGYLTIQGKKINHTKIAPELIKDIYKGHEVASHTLTHPNLTTLSPEEVVRQVENDRSKLSELVGYEVQGFAYPCGGINSNRAVADLIKNKTFKGEISNNKRVLSTQKFTAYLKISDGCNNRCTYCAIPYIRGPYISRKMEDILEEAEKLAKSGIKELISSSLSQIIRRATD